MRELTGNDDYQLYEESPVQHQHTLKVVLVDPAGAHEPLTIDRVRAWAASSFPTVPPLCWRVARLGRGRPVWIDRPQFDLDYHVRAETLPAPGGRAELAEVLGRLKASKLDRAHPLWRLWLVDGLADGRVAMVWAIHHAVADGGATVELLDRVYQHGPDERPVPAAAAPTEEPDPTRRALLAANARQFRRKVRDLPSLALRSAYSVRVGHRLRLAGIEGPARPFEAPMTHFNQPLTARRSAAWASLPLDDVFRVRRAFGATFNDVYLALVSAALRRYLSDHGELPDLPLTANVPVSLRDPTARGEFGNQVFTWQVRLTTDVDDPVERLRGVSTFTRNVRETLAARGDDGLQREWMDYTVAFRAWVALGNLAVRRAARPPFNVIVSNVKGPGPLWFDGAAVTEIYSFSQLVAGLGLNLTAWSYGGRLGVGVVACPEHIPDLWGLADLFGPALEELVEAAAREAAGRGEGSTAASSTRSTFAS